MRKSMFVMIAVLLVSALMISCNSDVSEGVAGGDSLAKVTVMSGTSKALTTVVSGSTNVEDLYWFYTATKTDGSLFITGQKTERTFIGTFTESNKTHGLINADLGLFSTGDWTFSFWGYKSTDVTASGNSYSINTNASPVYYQEGLAARVIGTTDLTVTLAEGDGMGDATVVFSYTDNNTTSYPYWDYALASNKSLTLYVYKSDPDASPAPAAVASQTKTTESNGHVVFDNLSSINLSSGTQTLYFRVMHGTECVGSFDLGLNVKSGTTISVYGLIENLDSTYHVYVRTVNKTKAEATIISENVGKTITEGTDTTIANTDGTTSVVTSKSPQNAASSSTSTTTTGTTVTLPNIILDTDETTGQGTATVTKKTVSHDLTVDVKSEDLAPSAFAIEAADEQAGLTAVAGIDLTLVKTTTTKTTVKESAEENANIVTENTVVSTDVVDTFKNGNETVYVTIETYIAKGLSDVKVRYNGTLASGVASHVFDENYGTANAVTDTSDAAYGTGYDPGTGRLVFKTPHFSSFYVIGKAVNKEVVVSNGNSVEFMTLAEFRNKWNAGEYSSDYADENRKITTVSLLKDIDISDTEWDPIGTWQYPFYGVINGNNKTINGLKQTASNENSVWATGRSTLFKGQVYGFIAIAAGADVQICDLTFANVNIDLEQGGNVGAVIGFVTSDEKLLDADDGGDYWTNNSNEVTGTKKSLPSNYGKDKLIIKNVAVYGKVKAAKHVGGFVGKAYNAGGMVFENCKNYADVTNSTASGGCAGILGYHSGSMTGDMVFENCHNYGNITSYANNGSAGIVATLGPSLSNINVTFNNCSNEGTIVSKKSYAAGIVAYPSAYVNGITIENCSNSASISAEDGEAAGIATRHGGEGKITLKGSISNMGTISATTYACGIVGKSNQNEVINNASISSTGPLVKLNDSCITAVFWYMYDHAYNEL